MTIFSLMALFPSFLLVFVRLTTFFVVAPIFSSKNIPQTVKIGLSFFLAILTFSYVGVKSIPFDQTFFLLILKEAFIGLTLGFIGMILLYAIQTAGSFIDMQMGFSIASVIDPQTGSNSSLMGQFQYALAILFLLASNAHHLLIRGVIESYKTIPVDKLGVNLASDTVLQVITQTFYHMFLSAFMIAAPLVASLFLVDVALGIVSRAVPQLNIFVVGLPIKIFAGFLILFVLLPGYFLSLKGLFQSLVAAMDAMLKGMGGS
jgi:flagellar biosynthesis protein FliR